MKDDFLKIVGILVIIGILVFLAVKFLKIQAKVMEGLTNPSPDGTTSPGANGEAGSAAQYAAEIKSNVIKLQDTLLITKYRSDYETVILNMDDYINMLMLKTVLNIKIVDDSTTAGKQNPNIELIAALNTLNSAKQSLNNVMKFVDAN